MEGDEEICAPLPKCTSCCIKKKIRGMSCVFRLNVEINVYDVKDLLDLVFEVYTYIINHGSGWGAYN
jgi:hypothetical protein